MRLTRLALAPITALAALGVAAPSLAADVGISVRNYDFTPATQRIAVGDKVTWSFDEGIHSTTSERGQAESWDSDVRDAADGPQPFEKTFTRPGRYQYLCTPHESFMRGTIVVGTDSVADTVDAFKTRVSGSKVTVSFKLNEAASATYTLTGAAKRTVKRRRLGAGKQSITVRRLEAGSYTGTLVLTDDFDKKTRQKKSFRVR
jgi:plastocyanin